MFNQTQKILFALGMGTVSLLGAGQVSAQQAFASGSSTLVLMNGATQSVGAELAAPGGAMFQAGGITQVQVDGVIDTGTTTGLSVNTANFNSLNVDAGTVTAATSTASFTAAAARALTDMPNVAGANSLADNVSIIRAGAGVDGLD